MRYKQEDFEKEYRNIIDSIKLGGSTPELMFRFKEILVKRQKEIDELDKNLDKLIEGRD